MQTETDRVQADKTDRIQVRGTIIKETNMIKPEAGILYTNVCTSTNYYALKLRLLLLVVILTKN